MRVDVAQTRLGRVQLGATHVRRPVENLPLEVAEIDGVEIHEADASHAGCREIERER